MVLAHLAIFRTISQRHALPAGYQDKLAQEELILRLNVLD
jgi:hypothetical protein